MEKQQVNILISREKDRGVSLKAIREELSLSKDSVAEALAKLETEGAVVQLGYQVIPEDDEYTRKYKRGRKRVVMMWGPKK